MAQSSDPIVSPITLAVNKILLGMSPAAANAEALYQRILAQRSAFYSAVASAHDKFLQRFVQLDDSLYTYDANGRPNGRTAISSARQEWAANVFPMIQLQARQLISDLVEFKKIGGLAGSEIANLDPRAVTALGYMKGLAGLDPETALDVGYQRVSRNCMAVRVRAYDFVVNFAISTGTMYSSQITFRCHGIDLIRNSDKSVDIYLRYTPDSQDCFMSSSSAGSVTTSSTITITAGSNYRTINAWLPKNTTKISTYCIGCRIAGALTTGVQALGFSGISNSTALFGNSNAKPSVSYSRFTPLDPEEQSTLDINIQPFVSSVVRNFSVANSNIRGFLFYPSASDASGFVEIIPASDPPFSHIDGLAYSSTLQSAVDQVTSLVNSGDPDVQGASLIVPDTILDISNAVKGLFSLITDSGVFSVQPNLIVEPADLP